MTAKKKERNRIALVTGANRGLGFETCRQLAQLGLTVILSARDLTKGEVAAKQLIERGLDVILENVLFRMLSEVSHEKGKILMDNSSYCRTIDDCNDSSLCKDY